MFQCCSRFIDNRTISPHTSEITLKDMGNIGEYKTQQSANRVHICCDIEVTWHWSDLKATHLFWVKSIKYSSYCYLSEGMLWQHMSHQSDKTESTFSYTKILPLVDSCEMLILFPIHYIVPDVYKTSRFAFYQIIYQASHTIMTVPCIWVQGPFRYPIWGHIIVISNTPGNPFAYPGIKRLPSAHTTATFGKTNGVYGNLS